MNARSLLRVPSRLAAAPGGGWRQVSVLEDLLKRGITRAFVRGRCSDRTHRRKEGALSFPQRPRAGLGTATRSAARWAVISSCSQVAPEPRCPRDMGQRQVETHRWERGHLLHNLRGPGHSREAQDRLRQQSWVQAWGHAAVHDLETVPWGHPGRTQQLASGTALGQDDRC